MDSKRCTGWLCRRRRWAMKMEWRDCTPERWLHVNSTCTVTVSLRFCCTDSDRPDDPIPMIPMILNHRRESMNCSDDAMSLVAAISNDSLFGDIGSHRTCYRRQQRPQPPMTGNAYPTTDNWTIAVSAAVEVTSYEHGWHCCRSYPLFHQLPALHRLHHGKKHITFQKNQDKHCF